jgi:transposase
MNLKLHFVLDDLTGLTGQAILAAIVAGERDPQALAKLRHHRVKASEAVVAKALEGDWRPEHLLVLRLAWENWQHLQAQIGRCDEQLGAYTRQLVDHFSKLLPLIGPRGAPAHGTAGVRA